MKMEVKINVEGEEYILKGKAVKVEHVEDDYKHRAKFIAKCIKKVDEPRTLKKVTDEARKETVISMRHVKKILDLYDGKLWESSTYRHPSGGKPTSQYKLIKKKKDK